MKYVDIDSSTSLDHFTEKHSGALLRRLDKTGNRYKFNLSMKAGAKDKDGKISVFEVKGTISVKGRTEFRSVGKSSKPKTAVTDAIKSLEKQVRRWSEKTERSRKTMGKSMTSVRDFKIQISR